MVVYVLRTTFLESCISMDIDCLTANKITRFIVRYLMSTKKSRITIGNSAFKILNSK